MDIPEKAVEAAVKASYEARTGKRWDLLNNFTQDIERAWMQVTLEAAAPHMLAEAWGEGYGAGWNDCLLDLQNGGAKMSPNPYRSQA